MGPTDLQVDLRARVLRGLPVAVVGGLATGGFAAWAYYADTLRPVAHSFGLWITLVALLSLRRTLAEAVARSTTGLAAAVVAFYVGKDWMYALEYPGAPYSVNTEVLQEWLVLAVVAGCLFGWAFHRIGADRRAGAVSTAALMGLLVADTARRSYNYRSDLPVVGTVAVVGIVLVLAVTVRSPRQLGAVALWAVPMTVLGLLLVSLPDALEQLTITGGL